MKMRCILIAFNFLFCFSIYAGVPEKGDFLPVVPCPAEYSAGEGYFIFGPETTFGIENESQLRMVSDFVSLFRALSSPILYPGSKLGMTELMCGW